MYELFTKRFTSNNSVIRVPAFDYIRRTYQKEVARIVEYYQSRVYAVKSNHLLCRLLTTALVPMSYDLERYTEAAFTRSPYVAKHFNFTSEINYGEVFKGIFYGKGCDELIIYYDEYFDAAEVLVDWKKIQAVKVITHPVSNLGLLLPNGNKNNREEGLAVISINLPLLLVQYRGFILQQASKFVEEETDSLLAVSHFVHMYVLPNMLYSHADMVLVNRTMNLYYGAPMGEALTRHPFAVSDYSDKVDRSLNLILKKIQNNSMFYYSSLKNIPSFFSEDSQESMLLPDLAETRQVWWALLLSRLYLMKFLLDAGGTEGIANNGRYVNDLKIDVKRMLRDNSMKAKLPKDLYHDVSYVLEDILAM